MMLKRTLFVTLAVGLWSGCGDDSSSQGTDEGRDVERDRSSVLEDTSDTGSDLTDETEPDRGETDRASDSSEETDAVSDLGEEADEASEGAGEMADRDDGTEETGEDCPVITDLVFPAQSGVAYVAHFASDELRWYRTDGAEPSYGGTVTMASSSYDMDMEPISDLLAVAHDLDRAVALYQLYRPDSPSEPVDRPRLVATIDLADDTPRRLIFDSGRQRLYIVANAPLGAGELLTSELLYVYDVSEPTAPVSLAAPQEIPVTITIAHDPYAGILGLIGLTTNELVLYDASSPQIRPLAGDPIDLRALYPQVSSNAFQPRNLRFDPANGRILAARAQTNLSEVIAFSYPSVAGSDAECPDQPGYDDLVMIEDGFDVDLPVEDWDNLLGAHDVIPIPGSDAAMFVATAWNGVTASSLVIPLSGDLEPQVGCGEYAGMGCFYQSYYEGTPRGYQLTDGAACVDGVHGVVVGTSINELREDDPGQMHFFRYDADLTMTVWETADRGTLAAAALPLVAECH
jgi:hypothetical protein